MLIVHQYSDVSCIPTAALCGLERTDRKQCLRECILPVTDKVGTYSFLITEANKNHRGMRRRRKIESRRCSRPALYGNQFSHDTFPSIEKEGDHEGQTERESRYGGREGD